MFELFLLVIGLFAGYHLGQMVLSWQLRDLIVKEARKEGIRVDGEYNVIEEKDVKPTVFQLFIERANNVLYLYDRDEGAFICQGSTMEELAKLAKQYKNIRYAAVMDEHTDDVVAFVDGEVKTDLLAKTHES